MEQKLQIEFIHQDKNIFNRLRKSELIQTKPFKIGFLMKNIGAQPIQGLIIKNISWASASGQNIFATSEKSFHIETLNPNEEKKFWVDKTGTYMHGLCHIKLDVISDNGIDKIKTFQKDHFTGTISSLPTINQWIDFFFIRSKSEYEQSRTNNFNIFFSIILVIMTLFTIKLTQQQTKYAQIQSIPEQINQAREKKSAIKFCKQNPEATDSGLYYLDGTGKTASCSDVLQLENNL